MLHDLHGAGIDKARLIDSYIARGRDLPASITDVPELGLGEDFYYQAFWDLTTTRAAGPDTGPIPWSAIREWCEEHEICGVLRRDVFFLVRALDMAYLDFRAAKLGNNGKSVSTAGNKNPAAGRKPSRKR